MNAKRIGCTTVVVAALLGALAATACSGAQKAPPPPPKKQSPEDRILVVGKNWREMHLAQAYTPTPDVAFIKTEDSFTLHLQAGSPTATVALDRKELIRTPQGREFHCNARGAIQAAVEYAWRLDEPELKLTMPGGELPRTCEEPGFPHRTKVVLPLNATYVLRGDQLIAIEPAPLRSVLNPMD